MNLEAAYTDFYKRPDLDEFETYRAAGGLCQACTFQVDATQCACKHISKRGKANSQLIRAQGMGAGAVGKQIQLLFFNAVLHVFPGTINIFI